MLRPRDIEIPVVEWEIGTIAGDAAHAIGETRPLHQHFGDLDERCRDIDAADVATIRCCEKSTRAAETAANVQNARLRHDRQSLRELTRGGKAADVKLIEWREGFPRDPALAETRCT